MIAAMPAPKVDAPAAALGGGSGTKRNSGRENASHQTATVRNDSRTASAASPKPNQPGARVMATLPANSRPPPM